MLLFLSNSHDLTCDYFCNICQKRSVPYVRFNTDFKLDSLAVTFDCKNNTLINYNEIPLSPSNITAVWNRRPEKVIVNTTQKSAFDDHFNDEWRCAILGFFYQIPFTKWVNHPFANINANNKIEQLVRAKEYDFIIPDTIVTQDYKVFNNFYYKYSGEIITKPISHGYIKEHDKVFNIYTSKIETNSYDITLFEKCPTLFQEKISKICDIRILYIDGMIECVEIKPVDNYRKSIDIRWDNMNDVQYSSLEVPEDIINKINKLIYSYKLRFAAIDMAIAKNGDWIFFEINPNGQWAWLDILGITNFNEKLLYNMIK